MQDECQWTVFAMAIVGFVSVHLAHAQPPAEVEPSVILDRLEYFENDQPGMEPPEILEYEQYLAQHPEVFVPLLRARLMKLPATLDDFDIRSGDWSISAAPYMSGGRPRCLRYLSMLDEYPADVIDPIVQEFFSALANLALHARDKLESEGQARGDMDAVERAPGLAAFRETIRKHDLIFDGLDGAVKTAHRIGSAVLLDDVIALLQRDGPSAQETGARYIEYALVQAESKPEVAGILRRRGEELSTKVNERSARVGAVLLERVGRLRESGTP